MTTLPPEDLKYKYLDKGQLSKNLTSFQEAIKIYFTTGPSGPRRMSFTPSSQSDKTYPPVTKMTSTFPSIDENSPKYAELETYFSDISKNRITPSPNDNSYDGIFTAVSDCLKTLSGSASTVSPPINLQLPLQAVNNPLQSQNVNAPQINYEAGESLYGNPTNPTDLYAVNPDLYATNPVFAENDEEPLYNTPKNPTDEVGDPLYDNPENPICEGVDVHTPRDLLIFVIQSILDLIHLTENSNKSYEACDADTRFKISKEEEEQQKLVYIIKLEDIKSSGIRKDRTDDILRVTVNVETKKDRTGKDSKSEYKFVLKNRTPTTPRLTKFINNWMNCRDMFKKDKDLHYFDGRKSGKGGEVRWNVYIDNITFRDETVVIGRNDFFFNQLAQTSSQIS